MSLLAWRERFQTPARIAYLLILLLATLTPFRVSTSSHRVSRRIERALHPTLDSRDVVDGARNLVLFAGWGVVWTLTSAGVARRIALSATATGGLISVAVETAQLFSSNRDASLLDVTTDTGGAFAGAVILLGLVALATDRRRSRSYVGIPALFFAGSYGTAAWLEAVIPLFRQDRVPGAFGWPTTRLAASLAAFRWDSLRAFSGSDIPLFLPAGAFVVVALVEHGVPCRTAVLRTVWGGCALALLAELLHGLLGQPLLLGAVVVHAATVAGGAWVAGETLPHVGVELGGSRRARALMAAYAVTLAAWAWRPFLPEVDPAAYAMKFSRPWYVPLAALGGRVDFFSVVDVCAPFFLYLPLGGLLAVWPIRRHGWLSGPLPAVWLAVVCELGQLVVAGRLPDVTDMMVQASGAAVGWAIVRLAEYPVYGEAMKERAHPPDANDSEAGAG